MDEKCFAGKRDCITKHLDFRHSVTVKNGDGITIFCDMSVARTGRTVVARPSLGALDRDSVCNCGQSVFGEGYSSKILVKATSEAVETLLIMRSNCAIKDLNLTKKRII